MSRSTTRSPRRARRILFATALAAVALPAAAAEAAEVTASGPEIVVEDRSGRGVETNRILAEALPGGELRLTDQRPLVSKTPTCVPLTDFEVRCVRPSTSPITKLTVRAGGDHDHLRVSGSLPIRYEGGTGDDTYFGGRTAAPTRVDFAGGDGNDFATYAASTQGVHAHKDDQPGDGRPAVGDADNIRVDVEGLTGSQHADVLASEAGGEIIPLGGDDVVHGGSSITAVRMGAAKDGADRVLGTSGTFVDYSARTAAVRAAVDLGGADDGEAGEGDELVGVGEVEGGSGDDRLLSLERRPGGAGISFWGGPGADTITGTEAFDRLIGGPGRDVLGGLEGRDELYAEDGEVDHVFCGEGIDAAWTDTAEFTVSSCETRITP